MAGCRLEPPLGGPRDCLGVWWAQRLGVGPLVCALVLLWLREYQGDCTVHRPHWPCNKAYFLLFSAVTGEGPPGLP